MRFLLFLSFLLLSLSVQAQSNVPEDYLPLSREAYALYERGDYEASANAYVKLFEAADFSIASDRYNAACSFALAEKPEEAIQQLTKAAEMGWHNLEHTKSDSDLNSLHALPAWEAILAEVEANREKYEAQFDSGLRKRFQQVMIDDQLYRQEISEKGKELGWQSEEVKALWAKQTPLDSANEVYITHLLDSLGRYPGRSLVGPDLSSTAFLVIQHADHDTQKKYLPMLEKAANEGEMAKSSLALLIDRILIRDGKPQKYGSQVRNNTESGKQEFYPIEDEPRVNERRAEMDLPPLEDYARYFGIEYSLPQE